MERTCSNCDYKEMDRTSCPEQWCYMFLEKPEEGPCGQHFYDTQKQKKEK